MAHFKEGSYRVYFNGIDIPSSGVSVQYGVMTPPVASIEVSPDRELLRLGQGDRVHVLIFFLDTTATLVEGKLPEYRLLFEGEITGWTYSTNAASRNISFSARGLSAVLEGVYPRGITNSTQIADSAIGGSPGDMKTYSVLYPTNLIFFGLSDTTKPIQRPYDFIENMFRAMFGAAEYADAKLGPFFSSSAVHFFARWARRWNYVNRWAPSPYVEGVDLAETGGTFPILKSLQSAEIINVLKAMVEQLGKESLLSLAMNVMNSMYYEYTDLPNMPMVTYDLDKGVIAGPPVIRKGARVSFQYGRGPADPKKPLRLLNNVTKPQLPFCTVPRCNMIFPSMITAYQYGEDYTQQITRMYVQDPTMQGQVAPGSENTPISHLLRSAYPERARKFLQAHLSRSLLSEVNFLDHPEEYFRGPVTAYHNFPAWFSMMARKTAADAAASANAAGANETDRHKRVLSDILDVYSTFEYYKTRTASKSGGVTMRFNPYLAPGFPAVIFDNVETNVHVFCYLINVSHQLSPNGMSTTANFTFSQTFDEFFELYTQQVAGAKTPNLAITRYYEARDKYNALATELTNPTSKVRATKEAFAKAGADLTAAEADMIASKTDLAPQLAADVVSAKAAVESATQTVLKAATAAQVAPQVVPAAPGPLVTPQAGLTPEQQKAADELAAAETKLAEATAAFEAAIAKRVTAPDMVPVHPVDAIATRFQVIDNAAPYYQALFQQNMSDPRGAVFDWRKDLGVVTENGIEALTFEKLKSVTLTRVITKPIQAPQAAPTTQAVTEERVQVQTNAIQFGNYTYTVQPHLQELMNNSEAALQYVSRPIVSLDEYIDFSFTRGLRSEPQRDGPATYYIKILDLLQGPGVAPDEDLDGNPLTQLQEDTRRDWETKLRNYREKVLSKRVFTS